MPENNKLKIVFFCSYYPPIQIGGSELYVHELARTFKSMGHDIKVVTFSKKPYTPHEIKEPYSIDGIDVYLLRIKIPIFDPSVFIKMCNYLKETDILHIHTLNNPDIVIPIVLSAKALGIPILWTNHTYEFICPTKFVKNGRICNEYKCKECFEKFPFKKKLYFYKYKLARNILKKYIDVVIAPSEYVNNVHVDFGFEREKVLTVHHGINIDNFKFHSLTEQKNIFFAGYLYRLRGYGSLIRAFKKINDTIPDAKLIIGGEGPDRERIMRLKRKFDLKNMKYVGKITHKEMCEYYKRSRVVVNPTHLPEVFGLVGIEAMSVGRPVVASRIGGITDWLYDGVNGFLVEPNDTKELINKISILLEDKKLAEKMGVKGRHIVEKNFSIEQNARKLLTVYSDIMERPT